ncbi:hypothetical protein DQR71_08930 [Salmonella enterica subsp. enterica serovar Kingston]|nr:hypothetical protein [Salmonella enterica subsp. enterica serovar Kingston]
MNNTTSYLIQYGATALDLNPTQVSVLLALIHFRDMNQYNKICNPTRERLAIACGLKKMANITTITNLLADRGFISKISYGNNETKSTRNQYTIHDDVIIEQCKRTENEWYAKFEKQDEETEEQAFKIANPEMFTEKEVEEAITPPLKPIPEGKQKDPVSGRIINRTELEKPKGRAMTIAEIMREAEQANATTVAIETVVKNTIDELAFSEDEDCPW